MWVNDIFDVVKFLCGVKSFKVNWILDGLGDRVIFLLYFSVVLKNVEVEEEISWLVIVEKWFCYLIYLIFSLFWNF